MYNGIEIDMLSLGDADCILVSFWIGQTVHRVLIDGGNKGNAPTVRAFLRAQNITTIDDVLSTHHHDDHSGGLIKLLSDETLTFGKFWCHIPQWHVGSMDKVWAALQEAEPSDEAANIRESLRTVASLYDIAAKRSIAHEEPFKGKLVGFLEVGSPTLEFYTGIVEEMTDVGKIKAEDAAQMRYDVQTTLEESMTNILGGALSGSSLLPNPHTAPENEGSAVLGIVYDTKKFLFTGDAGTCALANVVRDYNVRNLHWLQIPHHGSRRNLTKSLIETFSPKTAYVSAGGSDKHPRRAVVNAFKKIGTSVYSTHYPNGAHLCHSVGAVPPRTGYNPATALWDEKRLSKSEPDWSTGLAGILAGKR